MQDLCKLCLYPNATLFCLCILLSRYIQLIIKRDSLCFFGKLKCPLLEVKMHNYSPKLCKYFSQYDPHFEKARELKDIYKGSSVDTQKVCTSCRREERNQVYWRIKLNNGVHQRLDAYLYIIVISKIFQSGYC